MGCAVCETDTFDPALGGEEFGVPAVGCVVRELVWKVLSIAEFGWVGAKEEEKKVCACEEIGVGFVCYEAVADSIGQGGGIWI